MAQGEWFTKGVQSRENDPSMNILFPLSDPSISNKTVTLSGEVLPKAKETLFQHIPEKANHPIISFPLRTFGNQQRAFQSSWYIRFPWLHYQEGNDSVLCFYCLVANKRNLSTSGYMDDMFIHSGFANWKKALEKFEKHQNSNTHREATDLVIKIPKI